MKLISLTVLLVLGVTMVFASNEQTGNTFCNSGPCTTNSDCDLGVCCGGECKENYPVLTAGFGCSSNDPCSGVCPQGQSCESGKCTDISSVKGKDAGCSCSSDTDCSGRCIDGSCVLVGLSVNDKCSAGFQCKSGNCSEGLCLGKEEGEPCVDLGYSGDCAEGLVCSVNSLGNSICIIGAGPGEVCNTTVKCSTLYQSCIGAGSVCANLYSGNVGDVCGSDVDCKMDLVCGSNAQCQSNLGLNCGAEVTCAAQTQQCQCNGAKAVCKEVLPACSNEYAAYISCAQNAGCRDLSPLDNGFPHPDQCIYQCIAQYATYQCCRSCQNSTVTFSGLQCNTQSPIYTPPSPCCDASGVCSETPGVCPGSATTAGAEPTSAATTTVVSSWMVLAALASFLFKL